MRTPEPNPRQMIWRLELAGYAIIAVLFGGVGVWAATSHIAGAVIAPGAIAVQSNVKKVQHLTGGVVAAINVHDGDAVKASQVLIRLDDTVARSTVGVVRAQLDELEARQARLIAERDGADHITFPPDLLARQDERQLAATLAGEQKLFESRRAAKVGERQQLQERIAQAKQEIAGLDSQRAAKDEEIAFISEELNSVTALYTKNLVSISRLMQLRRDKARLSGERGQYVAGMARANGKISETELQIIQLDKDFRTEVLKDLRQAQGKIGELTERLIAAQDQLKHIDIRAPQDGIVNQLAVHTIGGVISNGEVLLEIVPQNDRLIIEAKVNPRDIDQVRIGEKAVVRVMAGEERANPDLTGKLIFVSADLMRERSGSGRERAFYKARISLPAEEVQRLKGLKLMPGMPVEAFIQTYARTPLEYLIKPLKDQMARTFRER